MQQTINKPLSNQHQTTIKPLSNQVRNGDNTTIKPTIKPTTTPFRGCGLIGLIGLLHHIARLIAEAGFKVARGIKEMDSKASELAKIIADGRKARKEREEARRELERLLSKEEINPGMVVTLSGQSGEVHTVTIDYPLTGHKKIVLQLRDAPPSLDAARGTPPLGCVTLAHHPPRKGTTETTFFTEPL